MRTLECVLKDCMLSSCRASNYTLFLELVPIVAVQVENIIIVYSSYSSLWYSRSSDCLWIHTFHWANHL